LLGVVPLVQRPGLVDALVALEPDQPRSGDLGDGLGQLRLADAGRALDEKRLAEAVGEEDGRGDRGRGQIAGLGEASGDFVDGTEHGASGGSRVVCRCAATYLSACSPSLSPGIRCSRKLVHRSVSSWAPAR